MCRCSRAFLFFTDNSRIPSFVLNPKNYLIALFNLKPENSVEESKKSDAETHFGKENVRPFLKEKSFFMSNAKEITCFFHEKDLTSKGLRFSPGAR